MLFAKPRKSVFNRPGRSEENGLHAAIRGLRNEEPPLQKCLKPDRRVTFQDHNSCPGRAFAMRLELGFKGFSALAEALIQLVC